MSLQKLLDFKNKLPKEYQERLIEELDIITNNNIADFSPYFLILKESIDWVKSQGYIIGPLRGSFGGSLVSFLMGLHSLDPIKYKLPLKRFISKERLKQSIPDADIDYPSAIRDKLNDYLFAKYGDRAALVSTFGMRKLKNSLQDAYRIKVTQIRELLIKKLKDEQNFIKMNEEKTILEKETWEFNEIRKSLGSCPIGISDLMWLDGGEQDGAYYPGLLESHLSFKKWAERYPEVIAAARDMLNIPKNLGQHAAGIVISDIPIKEICPVLKHGGKNVIAYDKKTIQKLGLIKNDNLSLTCLDFIQDCLTLLKQQGISLDPWDLPDEAEVYKSFLDNRCLTIFQHETLGASSFVKKLQPKSLEDIAYSVSLNRPGALNATVKMVNGSEISGAEAFVKRKHGEEPISYIHNDLTDILKDTQGIPIFQEQVMEILQKLVGYTEEGSDAVRSAISDKNLSALSEVKEKLYSQLPAKNWSQEQIGALYDTIMAWGKFGFNKSHAFGYAKIAYCTAYLKTKFPLEWWCSVLSSMPSNEIMEKMWPEVHDKIEIPDVNASKQTFIINNGKLIPPLKLIANVGPKAIEDIALKAPFASFEDFVERIDGRVTNKRTVTHLVLSGALDSLLPNLTLKEKLIKYLELKAKKEGKKKLDAIDIDFDSLNPLKEYILSKKIFPVKNIELSKIIEKTEGLRLPMVEKHVFFNGREELAKTLRGEVPLISGKRFMQLSEDIKNYDDKEIDICCFGYVVATRKFGYFSKKLQKDKEALELTLDIDNNVLKIVCWPRSNDFSPQIAKYIKDENVYLFKIRIAKDENFKYGIIGVEEIA